jgi:two-component system response regulator
MASNPSILLIEDSPGECELFRLALAQTGLEVTLYTEHDADAALHFLEDRVGHHSLPLLILLDLQLRRQHGRDVLKRLRADSRFAAIPVVIFTTSDDAADLATSYAHGANGYVVKPGTYDALIRFTADLCHYWMDWNRTASSTGMRC